VDLVLKLESTKEFEELFNAWFNEILSELTSSPP
jgi:hypothetical protein